MIDAYQTETGVDAGTSTNETYDSSGKYYSGYAQTNVPAAQVAFTTVESTTWSAPTGLSTVTYLVVAGGGAGGHAETGNYAGGGGGAGGLRTGTHSVTGGNSYTVTVGAGGASSLTAGLRNGGNSVFDTITSAGGGGGASQHPSGESAGGDGGSGGGGVYNFGPGSGNTPSVSPSQGYGGGAYVNNYGAGGGGGYSAAGGSASSYNGGPGGNGSNQSGTFGAGVGVSGWFSGGGGGGAGGNQNGAGGTGGGGNGGYNGSSGPGAVAGTTNTGGGGGGANNSIVPGAAGGSGTVLIKYDAYSYDIYNNMTLVSNTQTAQAEPDEGRLMLYEEAFTGTITLDTDLKGYVSRDGGTTYTQTPLTLDTTYETGKTLVSGSVDISGQPSGTSMRYKIETLNQGSGKVCRLHGASLLWA